MPAAYNGLFSLKPSCGRLPWNGIPTNVSQLPRCPADSNSWKAPGQALIPTVPGLVGHSVRSLKLVFKSILSAQPWKEDAAVLQLPWRDEIHRWANDGGLTIGIFEDDGVVVPQPPMARALRMTSEAIQKHGHQVEKYVAPSQ